jgi:hypothetical protein
MPDPRNAVNQQRKKARPSMDNKHAAPPEIESLNLSDIDVSALDARLEMSTIVPNVVPDCFLWGYAP